MLYAGVLLIFLITNLNLLTKDVSKEIDTKGVVSISLSFVVSFVNRYVKYTYIDVAITSIMVDNALIQSGEKEKPFICIHYLSSLEIISS